jgi:transposase
VNDSIGLDSLDRGQAMPRPYSADLRARVIEAVEDGASRHEAAERFGISASAAIKWLRRWRDDGLCAAKPTGGSRSELDDYAEQLIALVHEQPDRTLDELVAAMGKRRIPGSRSALWRFLDRHGMTFKKKPASRRATASGRGTRPPAMDSATGASRYDPTGVSR